jgi:hypothetical protein
MAVLPDNSRTKPFPGGAVQRPKNNARTWRYRGLPGKGFKLACSNQNETQEGPIGGESRSAVCGLGFVAFAP